MPDRPNVLFLIADDHRASAIGAHGIEPVRTPALDGLIERGICWRNNYHPGGMDSAVCIPTRAALLTGVNPLRAIAPDVEGGRRAIDPSLPLLPELFRRAGYHTFATGKWHNDRASFTRAFTDGARLFFGGMSDHEAVPLHDFDGDGVYLEETRYPGDGFSTELFADAAVRFLETRDRERPFFLYCAFTAPHDPRTPPAGFARSESEIPLPPNFLPRHPFDNGELHNRDERLAGFPRSEQEIRRHIAGYYGMIDHLDSGIARILDGLEQAGLGQNTLVVYTADHGLAVGQHGLLGKQNLYDHSLRVPLIAAGPGLPTGREIRALTCTHDIFPTLCRLAGIDVPPGLDARSLLPPSEGQPGRSHLFALYKDIQRMVRDKRWKLIRYYRGRTEPSGTEHVQLFDLDDDPWEIYNVSDQPDQQMRIHQMEQRLRRWQMEIGDPLLEAS